MSKVLILGICPLPIEGNEVMSALGIRTWQFTKPLLEDGHNVRLICSRRPGSYDKDTQEDIKKIDVNENFNYYSLAQDKFLDLTYLQKTCDELQPDCIIGVGSSPASYAAVRIRSNVPIWVDQCGDLMAEAQMKAFIEKDDKWLYDYLKIDKEILGKGDIFSSISSSQRHALIGKLGVMGRLSKDATGYEFVKVVLNGIDHIEDMRRNSKNSKIIRGKFVKDDDFVILWSGSYNTWTDIDTLFFSLEKAMTKNDRIKFVSTGGNVPAHNNITYSHFLELINNSKFKERFIMLGWVPTKDLINIYQESDLGINIDKPCYEAELGCRNRILGWMASELAVLSTNFCELTKILDRHKIGFVFPAEDVETLSELILSLSPKKELLKEYARRAKNFVKKEFTYKKTTEALITWVKNPSHSLDNSKGQYIKISDKVADNI